MITINSYELQQCKKCGAEGRLDIRISLRFGYYVCCHSCRTVTNYYNSEKKAVKEWNKMMGL